MGAIVTYYDPWIKKYRYKGTVYKGENALTKDLIREADLTIITTAHTNVDYRSLQENATLIFDTKNAMKDIKCRDNIELL